MWWVILFLIAILRLNSVQSTYEKIFTPSRTSKDNPKHRRIIIASRFL